MGTVRVFVVFWTMLLLGTADADTSHTAEVQRLLADAQYYLSLNGRDAELGCVMRKLQRLGADPNGVVKQWVALLSMEDRRLMLMKWMAHYVEAMSDSELSTSLDAITRLNTYNANGINSRSDNLSPLLQDATKLSDALKPKSGIANLMYAESVELVAELQFKIKDYEDANKTFARALDIEKQIVPDKTKKAGDYHSEYNIKSEISRTMSKLADTYLILGDSAAFSRLRRQPETLEGDRLRISDTEMSEISLDKPPLSPQHTSCIPTL